jgi:hypothetical protein
MPGSEMSTPVATEELRTYAPLVFPNGLDPDYSAVHESMAFKLGNKNL